MSMLCQMLGVKEYSEGFPVHMGREETGRLVVLAQNEGGNNVTSVDLLDLLAWLRHGPLPVGEERDDSSITIELYSEGN